MLYWIIAIGIEVCRNYYLIEKLKERPNYLTSFGIRCFLGLLAIILTFGDQFDPVVTGIKDYIPYIIFQVTSFWLLFDIFLNLSRDRPIGYKGKNSGWLDKLPTAYYWLFKGIALITMIYTIFYIK